MAKTPRPELSSVFDDMLVQNKKRFDDLYRVGRPLAVKSGISNASSVRFKESTAPSTPLTPAIQINPDSPAARRLRERFGNDWRYEIRGRQREDDEAIVLCQLTFGKAAAVRSQFGRAKISQGPVAGASGGVKFKMGQAAAAGDEADAFRRAAEAALMNCLDLI